MTTYAPPTSHSSCWWGSYEFKAYNAKVDWKAVPEIGGVYIFAALEESSRKWVPHYIGETESFAERIPRHEKWPKANELRVSHVHVLELRNQAERERIEKELRQTYTPRLNEEYW